MASAAEFFCYTCDIETTTDVYESCEADWVPEKSFIQKCDDQDGRHCFTSQETLGNGTKVYKRGCSLDQYADFEEGNIRNPFCSFLKFHLGCIKKKDGSVCYKACTEEYCNKETDIDNISTTTTSTTTTSSGPAVYASITTMLFLRSF